MVCQRVCAASQFSIVLTAGGKVSVMLCTRLVINIYISSDGSSLLGPDNIIKSLIL